MSDNPLSGANVYAMANKPTVEMQSPMNLLAQAGQTAALVNANRLFQARVAAGQAQSQAIDPDTGDIDPRKANRLLSQDPTAAAVAGDTITQNQALQTDQQALQQKRAGVINSMITPLLTVPDAQLHDAAASTLDRAVTQGLIPADQATAFAMKLPNDPGQLRSTLKQMQLSTMAPETRQTQIYGASGSMNDGQSTQPGVIASPMNGGGFTPSGAATPIYPSRAELLSQQDGVDNEGRRTATPMAVRAGQQGAGSLTGPAGAAMANPPGRLPASLVPPGYTGRYASQAPAATNGAVPVGLAPGDAEAQSNLKQASVKQGVDLQASSDQSPARLSILNNMSTDLAGFTPGPGQTRETYVQSLMQRYAPEVAKNFGLDPQRVASAESFDKFASNLAMQQAGSLGAGTDAKLMQAMHANPNSGMSKLTIEQMIPVLQGNEDAIQAKNQAWQQWQAKNGPGSYAAFSTQFNQSFDPRAFQLLRMKPADQAHMLSAMPAADRAAFRQKVNTMGANGLLPMPSGAPMQGNARGY